MVLAKNKTYETKNGLKVVIHDINRLGEFMGTVYTKEKKNFGHQKTVYCGWHSNGVCVWPAYPEWELVKELPPE